MLPRPSHSVVATMSTPACDELSSHICGESNAQGLVMYGTRSSPVAAHWTDESSQENAEYDPRRATSSVHLSAVLHILLNSAFRRKCRAGIFSVWCSDAIFILSRHILVLSKGSIVAISNEKVDLIETPPVAHEKVPSTH
jgi:hypothetical protein